MAQSSNEPIATTTGWAKQVIDLYEQGGSDSEVAASLRVTIKQYYRQIQDSATFAQLVEFGRTLSQAYWESLARKNVGNKSFNTSLWAFYMKNKFNWADKVESSSTTENTNIDISTLREQVHKMAAAYIETNTPELTDAQRVLSNIGKGLSD